MDIRSMHYDFKQKINKIDSQQYRNLRVPEIDWKLNEAVDIFIKSIAEPRLTNHLGFETNQRSIDDIREIVVNDRVSTPIELTPTTYQSTLPTDYMFFVSAEVKISKSNCADRIATAILRQHDDRHKTDTYQNSSFEWREVNITFFDNGIKIFTDGTFEVKEVSLNYIRKHEYMHNAQDFLPGATYNLPNGIALVGSQDCELPEHTHREIVDIAVLVATGDLQIPDYQIKQTKLNLNQIN